MTLTTGLALFGAVVVALLALQWWWAGRRRQRMQKVSDTTTGGERVEPALDGEAAAPGPHGSEGSNSGSASPVDAAERLPLMARKATPRLDALIDAIVPLSLEAPITGDAALQHLPPTRRAGSKPFYVEGLDAETGEWEVLQHGRRYSELQAGVQLANRGGALNEIEFSEFMQKVQTYAEALGATVDGASAPDMLEVVARARELDGLAAPLDAQLTVTLRTDSVAWSVSFVQQVAARLGFVPGVLPGRMVIAAPDEGDPPILVLAVDAQAALAALDDASQGAPQGSAIRTCTLTLDVPQTPAAREPFPAWHLSARQLADEMDAALVDDQGQPISPQAFAEIGTELDGLYLRLEALGLPAGSAVARRLFS